MKQKLSKQKDLHSCFRVLPSIRLHNIKESAAKLSQVVLTMSSSSIGLSPVILTSRPRPLPDVLHMTRRVYT